MQGGGPSILQGGGPTIQQGPSILQDGAPTKQQGVQSVISRAQLPTCRDEGGQGS